MGQLVGYIATGIVSLVVGLLLQRFQSKPKLLYWLPGSFLFELKDPKMNTPRITLVSILLVLLSVPVGLSAEDQEGYTRFTTDVFETSMMNGKSWIKWHPQSRIMYLVGVEDGAKLLVAEMDNVQNEKDNAQAAVPAFERLMIKGFRFSDIMEEIDRFYEQASNRRIPVVDVYRYVLKKFKGAPPEKLAADQSALREKYNK